jgi:hypothetical protein
VGEKSKKREEVKVEKKEMDRERSSEFDVPRRGGFSRIRKQCCWSDRRDKVVMAG